jgi:class 3 adenylate cyclase
MNDLKGSGGLPTTPTSGVRAPEGEVTIVFSDITRAASLWEFNADAMRDATILHNALLRDLLKKHRGYEVIFLRCVIRHLNLGPLYATLTHTSSGGPPS